MIIVANALPASLILPNSAVNYLCPNCTSSFEWNSTDTVRDSIPMTSAAFSYGADGKLDTIKTMFRRQLEEVYIYSYLPDGRLDGEEFRFKSLLNGMSSVKKGVYYYPDSQTECIVFHPDATCSLSVIVKIVGQ